MHLASNLALSLPGIQPVEILAHLDKDGCLNDFEHLYPSFEKEFGNEFDTAMRETFEENYIEHDDDEDEFDPYIVGGGLTQRDFY